MTGTKVTLHKTGDHSWTALNGRYQIVGRNDAVAPFRVTGETEHTGRRSGCHVASLAEAREAINAFEASDGQRWYPVHS
jgi:hypothetical protein